MTNSSRSPINADWHQVAAALQDSMTTTPPAASATLQHAFDAFLASLAKPGDSETLTALDSLVAQAEALAHQHVEAPPTGDDGKDKNEPSDGEGGDKDKKKKKEPTEAERLGEEFARGFRRGLARHFSHHHGPPHHGPPPPFFPPHHHHPYGRGPWGRGPPGHGPFEGHHPCGPPTPPPPPPPPTYGPPRPFFAHHMHHHFEGGGPRGEPSFFGERGGRRGGRGHGPRHRRRREVESDEEMSGEEWNGGRY